MTYTMNSCILDQLKLRGPMQSDDLKHMCRLNVDGFTPYEYVSTLYNLHMMGEIQRNEGLDAVYSIRPR